MDILDQRPVELDDVGLHAHHPLKAGVAGARVVDGDPRSASTQRGQGVLEALVAFGSGGSVMISVRIDHVIYATHDLDAAAARVERELGLTALPGGRHQGFGTLNRIVPLGGGYLELLAVADPQEAASSDFGRGLLARLAQDGDGLLGWAVEVADVDAVAERLGTTVTTIRRAGLSARLTGLAEAMRSPSLPFFVSRDPGVPDPGLEGNAGGITWIELAGDARQLERWLDSVPQPVRVVDGSPAVRAVGIGEREFH